MAKIRTLTLPWTTLITNVTSDAFYPATGWMPAAGVEEVRASIEVVERTNNLSVRCGYQVADVVDSASPGKALGSAVTDNGVSFGTSFTNVTSDTQGKQLIRFGYLFANATSTSQSTGRVAGKLDVQVCG